MLLFCLATLARGIQPDAEWSSASPTRYLREFAAMLTESRLLWAAAGALAAPLVVCQVAKHSLRFGVVAGASVAVATAMLVAADLSTPTRFWVYLGLLAAASAAVELWKQWSQLVIMIQARMGATPTVDYRRQAVVSLGGNVGAIVGAAAGAIAAGVGDRQ